MTTPARVTSDHFFVRTLTPNDVAKLRGNTPGTYETDLGEMARDSHPDFWGWPDEYQEIVRKRTRLEWKAKGRLFSSERPQGVAVTVTLWYRESRPGHAAEHRMGLGPINRVRSAVPSSFDTRSLMVVERSPQGTDYDFIVRLITADEAEYGDFVPYLTEERPEHRHGYGR